jgi:hypothetical protein
MAYEIIQPPYTLKFREMSKTELKGYFRWFLDAIPERLDELANTVRQTIGFETWQPDCTPPSLDMLGEWLATQVETHERTEEELKEIKSRSPCPIVVSERELTNRTFSLAMDTGVYLSQVFLRNHPLLRWSQEFGSKTYVDYGQPVLIEFDPSPLNPVRMLVTQAYGLVSKDRAGKDLRKVYDYWSKQVRPGA